MRKIILAAIILLGGKCSFAASWSTKEVALDGACATDTINLVSLTTSTWSPTLVNLRFVNVEVSSAPVYMGFNISATTTTGYGFLSLGQNLQLNTNENVRLFFVSPHTGGQIKILSCR